MSDAKSLEKLILEKKLVVMRVKLAIGELHLLAISFCFVLFYPVLSMMIMVDSNIGINLMASFDDKHDKFGELVDEFNNSVKKYNAL